MCLFAAKFVPQLVTNHQKQRRVSVCHELQEKAKEDPTFTSISRIITGDESWIYRFDPKQSNNHRSGRAHNHQEQGMTFLNNDGHPRESQVVLNSIKENDFHGAFEEWKKRWDHCKHSQVDYFERDGSQI
jgi:hypothetical protein